MGAENFGAPLGSWCSGWLPTNPCFEQGRVQICVTRAGKYKNSIAIVRFEGPKTGACANMCGPEKIKILLLSCDSGSPKQENVQTCVVQKWTGKYRNPIFYDDIWGLQTGACANQGSGNNKNPIAMVTFGVSELGRVHFCVKGHFAGPKHFKTSKVCSVLASSKVTGTRAWLTDTRTYAKSQQVRIRGSPFASFRLSATISIPKGAIKYLTQCHVCTEGASISMGSRVIAPP